MKKIALSFLALVCSCSIVFASQPSEEATGSPNPKSSVKSDASSKAVYVYFKGEYADVLSGKTVIYSTLVTMSKYDWENKKDDLLFSFEDAIMEAFPNKTVHVGYDSISLDFGKKEEAKDALDANVIEALNQRYNAQFLHFRP